MGSFIIIYGYSDVALQTLQHDKSNILLIEPRKGYIDLCKTASYHNKNITVLAKCLDETTTERLMYNSGNKCFLNLEDKCPNFKREKVFTLSFHDLVKQYDIQNISEFHIQINIDNINTLFTSAKRHLFMISHIHINNTISSFDDETISFNFRKDTAQSYTNKNLSIPLPNIYMFVMDATSPPHDYEKLFQKYNIRLVNDTTVSKKNFINSIIQILKLYVSLDNNVSEIGLITNGSFLNNDQNISVLYPLKNNELYVDKSSDVIYASKTCLFMLYQILHSNHFQEYMQEKKTERKKLFYLYEKRYFWEYIEGKFVVKKYT